MSSIRSWTSSEEQAEFIPLRVSRRRDREVAFATLAAPSSVLTRKSGADPLELAATIPERPTRDAMQLRATPSPCDGPQTSCGFQVADSVSRNHVASGDGTKAESTPRASAIEHARSFDLDAATGRCVWVGVPKERVAETAPSDAASPGTSARAGSRTRRGTRGGDAPTASWGQSPSASRGGDASAAGPWGQACQSRLPARASFGTLRPRWGVLRLAEA